MCPPCPQLKTRQGTELLIQSEIDSVINDWYRALTETINSHVRTFFEQLEKVRKSKFLLIPSLPSVVEEMAIVLHFLLFFVLRALEKQEFYLSSSLGVNVYVMMIAGVS